MRSTITKSLVTLAAAASMAMVGAGVASAAPAPTHPGVTEAPPSENCVPDVLKKALGNIPGTITGAVSDPIHKVFGPADCVITEFQQLTKKLPI